MSMFTRFAPWLVFLIVTSSTDWRAGLAAGLVAQVIAIFAAKPRRVGVLDGAMLVFFVGMGVVALVRPDSPVEGVLGIVSMFWLATVAAASILVGRPFTLDFSRDGVPSDVAASKLFVDINHTIAWAWAGCFAAIGVASIVARAVDRSGLGIAATVILLIAAINVTKHYPDRAVTADQVSQQPSPTSL